MREQEAREPSKRRLFVLQDFIYDESTGRCVCPAGHSMYHSGRDMLFNGYRVAHYKAPITACRDCPLRAQCLRNPDTSQQRQLTVIKHREDPSKPKSKAKGAAAERMRRKFDTPQGRATYAKRMKTGVSENLCKLTRVGDRKEVAHGNA